MVFMIIYQSLRLSLHVPGRLHKAVLSSCSRAHDTQPRLTNSPLSCIRVLPVPSSVRTEIWESGPSEPAFASGHLLGFVRAIGFLGSVFATARRPLLPRNVFVFVLVALLLSRIGFIYFLVDVRGTTLRTSSYINCGPRL